jgi:hypothetical protein
VNAREFYVLDAMNVATTRYKRRGHGFEATAAQIAEVLNTDERFGCPFFPLTSLQVGTTLRALAQDWSKRRAPLVERVDTRRWRLSRAGLEVLCA